MVTNSENTILIDLFFDEAALLLQEFLKLVKFTNPPQKGLGKG